jgi:hypothetical protein
MTVAIFSSRMPYRVAALSAAAKIPLPSAPPTFLTALAQQCPAVSFEVAQAVLHRFRALAA